MTEPAPVYDASPDESREEGASSPLIAPIAPLPATAPRVWPAILTLFFLAPITAEVLSGSTPIIVFLTNPISFIFNPLLYGCGALLIREVARRRGLGWPSILLMGAAYGVFEEGLVINTWANPWMPQICSVAHGAANGICDYSRVGGISSQWALSLTLFHAVVSITIPILLVEQVFPVRAGRPWLGRKAVFACLAGEALCLALGLLLNVAIFRQHQQAGPLPAPYLVELALMAICIALALRLAPRPQVPVWPRPAAAVPASRHVPRLWTLRVLAFFALFEVIVSPYLYKSANAPYQLGLALNFALLGVACWRVTVWSHRPSWTDRQRLALASGALGFLLLFWDPVIELAGSAGGNPTRGTVLVALAYLIFLIVLARRTNRRVREQLMSSAVVEPTARVATRL